MATRPAYNTRRPRGAKKIIFDYAVIESFSDTAKGKAIALKQYAGGADVIFQAAGNAGNGVIEAAKTHQTNVRDSRENYQR